MVQLKLNYKIAAYGDFPPAACDCIHVGETPGEKPEKALFIKVPVALTADYNRSIIYQNHFKKHKNAILGYAFPGA
ncbi:MAG: hypothetical protein IIA63_01870 [Nitrospinae bacterium]|nr:hypothetical protein [Nitrospinota bacterium]MCH7649886.1 hypothetical protein [Nitrospinota bacterium]MCH8932209.1 hypothetical protein [Nitrospinota bacterium]